MTRPIWLLNFVLVAMLAWAGVELRARWVEAREREAAALAYRAPSAPPAAPQVAVAPAPNKFQAGQYIEVAERFLFAKDRNPNVVVEVVQPPPKKLMPALPFVHGVMDLGFGPTVFISLDGKTQQSYKVGEKVGDFQLKAANSKEISFDWEGESVTKALEDLKPRTTEAPAVPQQSTRQVDYSAKAPVAPPKPPENVRAGPGADIGGGRKGCLAGDNSPTGTVADGYRKVNTSYAFGPICYWESSR